MTDENTLLSLVVSKHQRTLLRHYVADTSRSISEIARRGIAAELGREDPELAVTWLKASPAERGKSKAA
ncbi:MAG TPA: hypothetical protein VGM07_21765 [Stellaceae bacterium]|jgi:hypothetical protein